ncbi:hypothetical protein EDB19DRAFT_2032978 [Suillus lakei]|nr:hypothetical protein EDB19DRAFT_2032978 [Suillus lakei]
MTNVVLSCIAAFIAVSSFSFGRLYICNFLLPHAQRFGCSLTPLALHLESGTTEALARHASSESCLGLVTSGSQTELAPVARSGTDISVTAAVTSEDLRALANPNSLSNLSWKMTIKTYLLVRRPMVPITWVIYSPDIPSSNDEPDVTLRTDENLVGLDHAGSVVWEFSDCESDNEMVDEHQRIDESMIW